MTENIQDAVTELVAYALRTGLIAHEDIIYAVNCVIRELGLDTYEGEEAAVTDCAQKIPDQELDDGTWLERTLKIMDDYACANGICESDSVKGCCDSVSSAPSW